MTDKQPAPVGDCHIVGKAVVPDFSELEAAAKRFQELMLNASMTSTEKQQEALTEAMEAYRKASAPSVILSLLRQNAALAAEMARHSMPAGRADQYASEARAVRVALGFEADAEDVAPVDLVERIQALVADSAALKDEMERVLDFFISEGDGNYIGVMNEPQMLEARMSLENTVVTDDVIANLKAQGVEDFASWLGKDCQQLKVGSTPWKAAKSVVMRAVCFAASLRASEEK